MFESFRELYSYRCMIRNLVKRDIRGRYKGSVLGVLWNLLLPLVQIIVYVMVFTTIFKPDIDNYAIYMITGMVLWFYFSDCLSEGSYVLVANGDMLKKIYFPRIALPISVVLARLVNFLIMTAVLIFILAITGYGISPVALLFYPLLVLLFIIFMVGMATIFSALDVFFRDVQYIITAILMALIWLTPIMYLREKVEYPILDTIITINPMTYYTEMMQSIFYWQSIPSIGTILTCAGISIGVFGIGFILFKYLEKDFAEVL